MDDGRFEVLLIACPTRRAEVERDVDVAGGRVIAALDWDQTAGLTHRPLGHAVLVLEAEGVDDDALSAALTHVRAAAEALALPVVARFTWPQTDLVTGMLLDLQAEFVCEGDVGAWVSALLVSARRADVSGLSDRWREGEEDAERMEKLNEEVARIAALLARLAGRERGGGAAPDQPPGDRHIAFGFEPPAEDADPALIRGAIRGRRMRDAFLGDAWFSDPAWDMMLDLYAAHLERVRVSVSSLCIAAAAPPTTALRWITRLTHAGVFDRHPDPDDRRRAFLQLSDRSLRGMNGYTAAMRRAGLAFA